MYNGIRILTKNMKKILVYEEKVEKNEIDVKTLLISFFVEIERNDLFIWAK